MEWSRPMGEGGAVTRGVVHPLIPTFGGNEQGSHVWNITGQEAEEGPPGRRARSGARLPMSMQLDLDHGLATNQLGNSGSSENATSQDNLLREAYARSLHPPHII